MKKQLQIEVCVCRCCHPNLGRYTTSLHHHGLEQAAAGGGFVQVCRACSITRGCKSPAQPDGGEVLVKRKGASREGWSEGSVDQSRDPTNRNRISGGAGRTSCLGTAKSISIDSLRCRSGGCAVKVIELTPGGLRRCPCGLRCVGRRPDRGAEVSRRRSSNERSRRRAHTARVDAEGSRCEGQNGHPARG